MQSMVLITYLVVTSIVTVPACTAASCPKEYKFSDELNQTYSLSSQGSIELQNINGDVHISAWNRDMVQVDAIKRAYAQVDMEKAQIQINSQPDAIKIRTVYAKSHAWDCEHDDQAKVEYNITVPRTAHLSKVELVNGNLTITNITGNVKASSVNGQVSVSGLEGSAQLSTVNGKLEAVFDHTSDS